MISKLVLVLTPLIATLTHWSTGSAFSMTCTNHTASLISQASHLTTHSIRIDHIRDPALTQLTLPESTRSHTLLEIMSSGKTQTVVTNTSMDWENNNLISSSAYTITKIEISKLINSPEDTFLDGT
ncbi:MAG: hypothetical protein CML33_07110 [Rhodobacteraceae bacterium]|nr:hypothetical protein [Paracoccaceae bacterium]|tara:strand:+ start:935 stop:1312 length:378 start_codon:yes stop_codon:yes gene_type:complete